MTKPKRSHKRRKSRARKKPSLPSFNGDHGTGTAAALAGTELVSLEDENGKNPNNMGQRRRKNVIKNLKLTMRQEQAATDIRDAYGLVEMLSSGSPLKAKVDSSPKPDAVVAGQVDAQSNLVWLMSAVEAGERYVVEHVCWHNQPLKSLGPEGPHKGVLVRALDRVADKKKY